MAEVFVQNTILTRYGLTKLNQAWYASIETRNESGDLIPDNFVMPEFNFTKIVVSNITGDLKIDTTNLENVVYELEIENIVQNGSILSFRCKIGEDIEGLNINQIGLYETVDNVDYLFAYGNVDINKSSTDYTLTLNIDFNIENVQLYKDTINVEIPEQEIVPVSIKEVINEKLWEMFNILQHPIHSNFLQLMVQPLDNVTESKNYAVDNLYNNIFDKERYFNSLYECYDLISEYLSINHIAEPSDVFMIPTTTNLNYTVNNLAKDNSKLTIENKYITSENDSCNFTNNNTLFIIGKFTGHDSIILNKIDNEYNFNFKIETVDDTLTITLGDSEHYLKYVIKMINWSLVHTDEYIHAITFDGTRIKYYLNGDEIVGTQENRNFQNTIINSNMFLSNNVSNTSTFSENQEIQKVIFINRCLTQNEIQIIKKIITYNLY